jgi:hypothetical protein
MVLGFNHNVMYRGEVFHVQTEDSGVAIPHIITLLYRGGVILCSQKTSYSDILKIDNLETVVEELMKEQHKGMMRRLKSGEFDERAFPAEAASTGIEYEPAPLPDIAADETAPATPSASETESSETDMTLPPEPAAVDPDVDLDGEPKELVSLDDAILAFFAANEK